MSTYGELLGAKMSPEEISRWMNADSVNYQTVEGLVEAIGLPQNSLCTACVTGKYPTPEAQRLANEIRAQFLEGVSEKGVRIYEKGKIKKRKIFLLLDSNVSGQITNVLVIGSGGREHALAWKVLQSPQVEKVFVAPGNGGTKDFNVPIAATEIKKLREFATEKKCFTIVGPEAPLAAGIVDEFQAAGLPIFGPTAEEAKLETSKAYAKEFMKSHSIPTADYQIFDEAERALDYAALNKGNVVVKVDGLAAGKGVFVCSTMSEAEAAIRSILEEKAFGKAGDRIVVEKSSKDKKLRFCFYATERVRWISARLWITRELSTVTKGQTPEAWVLILQHLERWPIKLPLLGAESSALSSSSRDSVDFFTSV